MQNKNLLSKVMLFVLAVFLSVSAMALPKVFVTSNITTNTHWVNTNIYVLSGFIYVTSNATLTIDPGTVIYGNDPTLFSKGALIITRGAKIMAVGTPCRPIVMTSGTVNPKQRKRGDWGGLILLGYAAINPAGDTAHIEGIPPVPETLYGGGKNPHCGGGNCPNNADNSGTLEYVRVEYAGVALSPNNEINGITFGGVGNGTTIDHVQVSYSNDDSYEWFGGHVDAKYIIAFRGIDDDFDTDNGWSGRVQFAIGLRDPSVADVSGSKAFESDNDANGSNNLPQTKGIFCNATLSAGGDTTKNSLFVAGAHIRRWSHFNLYNSIVMGFPEGLLIDANSLPSPNTFDNVLADTMVNDNIFGVYKGSAFWTVTAGGSSPAVVTLLNSHAGNRWFTGNAGILLKKPYTLGAPDFRPSVGSPALTGANFHHPLLNDPFFTKTNYIGAMYKTAAGNWAKECWVNFRPDTVHYDNGAFGYGVNCACTVPQSVAENQAVSSDAVASIASVEVSPNPNKGSFNVALKNFNTSTVSVKVADLNSGRLYFVGKLTNNSTTKVTVQAPNGNYVVEITDGKNTISRKVTILN